ncbi:SDR family oxidoreductase [Amycolatopsis rubida]|uniref:3-oxoacyl-[acyl-carrier protein] reductase n=1 Tax=Amycolatopsis rubida TaxID=112413 RepID=A0A1I5ID35_9PSEU|nr:MULTISPECIES: SDR family oxidoreductase [Amycolatopsis]MYW96804.1 SDR family oxidoreductase [Amycolatopsis rubida]NEC61789.1 SDR family oxidoreductase [Amycolatopsis rubida]OAP25725.1 Pyridoxal 4-dehydrogenase [Amycolatopsis sp. M39]SFO58170.1 3-oxoacyl-[acyl-carrier protein] reductase [Amycolatopsis rubida]
MKNKKTALVTGVGRKAGIGAAIASRLREDGWTVITTYWSGYDRRMPWGADENVQGIEADLADPATPARLFDQIDDDVQALVLAHCESVNSSLLDTTVDSFDRHFAVNARASWLLIREFAQRYRGPHGAGRIVTLTSDHVVHNLPYGASKGALDRITLAAAGELGHLGITANAVNPGPTDTGWIPEAHRDAFAQHNPLGRIGTPRDCASLVAFLCGPEGGWVNGQVLVSNGGAQ